MSRRAQTFKQGDITKALKAAVAAGLAVKRVEVDRDGRIVVVAGRSEHESAPTQANEWDSVK